MEFQRERVFTSLNADELREGDKVIVADTMAELKMLVEQNTGIQDIETIEGENCASRFTVPDTNSWRIHFALAYLVERKKNCTNCRLCNGAIKDDPTTVCENHEPQDMPPANCETCSKADTDRCPVPNPPKETGCGHWESKPARVCENCRNLERHGKDSNWCEVRELRLSDEAIKKNTCGYLKLVKAEPKTEQKAEKMTIDEAIKHCRENTYKGNCKAEHEQLADWLEELKSMKQKHYRPFKDTDELIKVWKEKSKQVHSDYSLTMPYIWVQDKDNDVGKAQHLITDFNVTMLNEDNDGYDVGITVNCVDMTLEDLFEHFEFLDGSPCGVEE